MARTDLIADAITRIRNGGLASHEFVVAPASKLTSAILKVLKDEGYVADYKEFEERKGVRSIKIDLKYHKGEHVIKEINKVSKQGRRAYSSIKDLPKFYGGLGVNIVSTSKGVMADHQARDLGVGGEIICNVY